MSPSATVWQQRSSMAQRRKIYQTVILTQFCWFWSFHGICWQDKNIKYQQISPLRFQTLLSLCWRKVFFCFFVIILFDRKCLSHLTSASLCVHLCHNRIFLSSVLSWSAWLDSFCQIWSVSLFLWYLNA